MRIAKKPARRKVIHSELAKKQKAKRMAITITQRRRATVPDPRGGGFPAEGGIVSP
jgi:hypothetical protein